MELKLGCGFLSGDLIRIKRASSFSTGRCFYTEPKPVESLQPIGEIKTQMFPLLAEFGAFKELPVRFRSLT